MGNQVLGRTGSSATTELGSQDPRPDNSTMCFLLTLPHVQMLRREKLDFVEFRSWAHPLRTHWGWDFASPVSSEL